MKPIVIYSDKILKSLSWFMPIGGMSLFPFIILREKYQTKSKYWIKRNAETINHETIHFQQALELGVIPFYILYIAEWFVKLFVYGKDAYINISFEREAYANDSNLEYLTTRRRYAWARLLF